MEFLPKNPIIQFDDNALAVIRKMYGYESTGRMREAVETLDAWAKKQNHLVVKEFSHRFLEATILTCKGSIEQAKTRIDKMCTFRTLLPQFFGIFDVHNDFTGLLDYADFAFLPKQAPGCRRAVIIRLSNNRFSSDICLKVFRLAIMVAEYLKVNEFSDGFIFIYDYRKADIFDIVKNANIMDLRNGMSILVVSDRFQNIFSHSKKYDVITGNCLYSQDHLQLYTSSEGFGARVHGMHIFTASTAVELLVNILKQTMSKKVMGRMIVNKKIDDIHKIIPKNILPTEYGGHGTTKTIRELRDDLLNELSTNVATEYRHFINSARTDEKLRKAGVWKDHYLGVPGSFRSLNVD